MELVEALGRALYLLVSFDKEVYTIVGRSLLVSGSALLLSSLFSFPISSLLSFSSFRGRGALLSIIRTFYSLPTVCVGLFLFVLFSREGPFGFSGILFTPYIMILGQAILISPIIMGLLISHLGKRWEVFETALSIGATRRRAVILTLFDARSEVLGILLLSFGRAISEVGCAIMVGGNIKGFTRVMTTAIALESSKGNIELALSLGIILLIIAFIINIIAVRLER